MYIAGFLVCAIIIFFAGKKLSFYGDLLADMTGMGKAFIGLILMSTVTSLPELMVGISSVSIVQSADLAMGDILGSCALNLSILSFMDVFTKKDKPLFSQVSKSHILAAAFGIILLALTGLGLFFDRDIVLSHTLGITSIGFGIIYFMSVRTIFKYQKSIPVDATVTEESHAEGYTLRGVILRYSAFALVIIVVALALPFFAEHIAEQTGLGKSFVGTLFLAVSTSLPEIAVSLAAVRMGSPDMAVGNLLGSNIFNIFILFIDDILYTKGLLLKDAGDINVMTVFMVVVMTAVAVIGFIFPYQKKRIFLAWDTLVIFLLYIVNLIFLYNMG